MSIDILFAVRFTAFALLGAAMFTSAAATGPDLISSDSNGIPLVADAEFPDGYEALDVSADGRYVLLSNYRLGNGPDANFSINTDECRILRKDRQTGELLTVFDSEPDGFNFCNGGKISADGNLVATSPRGSAVSCTQGGDVTALIIRNTNTGTDTEVTKFWSAAPSDIIRICGGQPGSTLEYPGEALYSLTGAGDFALLINYAVVFSTIQPVYELVDVAANTIEPVTLDVDEGEIPLISSVALSEDGMQLAVNAVVQSPFIPGPGPGPIICGQDGNCEPVGGTPTGGQPTGPSAVLLCGQVGRCDQLGLIPTGEPGESGLPVSYWQWGYHRPEPPPNNIYIIDRVSGLQSLPPALSDLPIGTVLQSNAWSTDGQRLSFLEIPKFSTGCFSPGDGSPPECFPVDACTGAYCELTVKHYAPGAGTLDSYLTEYDPDTLSLCRPTAGTTSGVVTTIDCTPKLSRDGNRLLYGRAVARPFGGDWSPNPFSGGDYVCVTRASLQDPLAEPEFIECPGLDLGPPGPGPFPGPVPGPLSGSFPDGPLGCVEDPTGNLCGIESGPNLNTFFNSGNGELGQYDPNDPALLNQYNKQVVSIYWGNSPSAIEPCYSFPDCIVYPFNWALETAYSAPVNWYVLDILTSHTTLVSVTDKGQLFQSNGTLFSDNGTTVIFRSQDPRLQDVPATPPAATEEALDEGCFWSPAGSSSNLRVATNDNTGFVAEDDFYVYRDTPVFCPVPDPEIPAQIFASDFADRIDVATRTFRTMRGWGWRNRQGGMQTLIGNFSRDPATLVSVTFEISGLGETGTVDFRRADNCEVYYPNDAVDDDSILARCEYDSLGTWEFKTIRWKLGGADYAFVKIETTINANEYDPRLRNNRDKDKVVLRKPRRPSWWRWWNR